jgi:hypothetical protein
MLLLVTIAHPQIVAHYVPGALGRMVQPRHYPRIADTAQEGIPWAADNDCFQGLDEDAYRRLLRKLAGLSHCLFVTVPDVVADHAATLRRWNEWRDECRAIGQPLAFVLQNGATMDTVPWDECDAVFVGGDTAWKLSGEASELTFAAHSLGKWVHMGRVNSRKRWNRAREMYCDSVDGTQFAMFRKTYLDDALTWHRDPAQLGVPGA